MTKTSGGRWREFTDTLYDALIVRREDEQPDWPTAGREFIKFMATSSVVVLIACVIVLYHLELYAWMIATLGSLLSKLIFASLAIGGGFYADKYKQMNQVRYGMVEITFGILSAFAIALSMDSTLDYAKWASLVGAGYVIARGLDNRAVGRSRLSRTVSPPASETPAIAEMDPAMPES